MLFQKEGGDDKIENKREREGRGRGK